MLEISPIDRSFEIESLFIFHDSRGIMLEDNQIRSKPPKPPGGETIPKEKKGITHKIFKLFKVNFLC